MERYEINGKIRFVHTNCRILFGSGKQSKDKYDIVLVRKCKD